MGIINLQGKRLEKQHIDVVEDQKPKVLEVSLSDQIELFEAVSCLPESSSFPDWATLQSYYEEQKLRHPRSSNVENTLFQLALFPYNPSSLTVANQPQYTSVMLPSNLKPQFPAGQSTCLTTLPCPCCFQHVSITLSHLGGTSSVDLTPSLPPPNSSQPTSPSLPESSTSLVTQNTDSAPDSAVPSIDSDLPQTMCAFTGKPYQELSAEDLNKRSREMQAQLEEMQRKYHNPPPDTPQYTAQNLPVAAMRCVHFVVVVVLCVVLLLLLLYCVLCCCCVLLLCQCSPH